MLVSSVFSTLLGSIMSHGTFSLTTSLGLGQSMNRLEHHGVQTAATIKKVVLSLLQQIPAATTVAVASLAE
jgi:hypothetical protein